MAGQAMGPGVPVKLAMLILVLAAVAAAMEAAPKIVALGPGGPRLGSFADTGPLGASEAGRALAEAGFRVGLGLEPPEGSSGVVYLVSGPAVCGEGDAERVAAAARGLAARGVRVAVVVAAGGEYSCGYLVASALAPSVTQAGQASGAYIAAARLDGGAVLLALYNPDIAAYTGAWRRLGDALGPGGRVPGVLEAESGGVTVVFIPDWKAFTNAMVNATREAGLDQAGSLVALVEALVGRGAVVLQPPMLYKASRPPPMALVQPGLVIAGLLDAYKGLEQSLLETIYSSLPLWVAASVAAVAVVALAVQVSMGAHRMGLRER